MYAIRSYYVLVSAGVNSFVSHRLYKVARKTNSIALEADALHLKTDVFTSLGVALGLLMIKITGLHILDPFIAIAVACFIIYESAMLLKKAVITSYSIHYTKLYESLHHLASPLE